MSDSTAFPRHLAPAELFALERYLAGSGIPERDVLSAQLPHVIVVGGSPPTIDLAVDVAKAESAHVAARGPLQPRMFVVGPNDDLWGEIMVWVTEGYLSGLGLAWWNDELPRSWDSVGATKYEWELPVEP